jgi:membrane protease YdiL (CAAX protease family)
MFPVGGIIVLHKSQRSEALTERNEGQIDPFDPPKAHLLGMVLVGLFLNGTIAEWLPAAVVFCLTSWFVISRKRAAPAQVFRLNPVSPSVLAFPIALAVVFWSLEVLALEGVDLVTRGSVSRWGKLFPSPVDSSLPFSEIVSTCILVPVAEEMFWRGFFSYALRRLGTGWAVVLPAIFFALLHHPVGVLGAFLVGVIAGILTARHDSILPAIVFHAAGNSSMCLLTAIGNKYGGDVAEVLYYAICVSGVLLVLRIRPEIAGLWHDVKKVFRDFGSRPRFGKNFKLLFRHWSYILVVLELALTVAAIVLTTVTGEPVVTP